MRCIVLWIPASAGNDGPGPLPFGLRIESAMTAALQVVAVSPSPLIPLPSRERGRFLALLGMTCDVQE